MDGSSCTANRRASPSDPATDAQHARIGPCRVAILASDRIGATRKELYFDNGRLILVASSEPSELLGEYLVRQGAIDRSELEMALLALPRYGGRLGDTLIGLGLVDPVEVFRAIQSQGRSRVADIFRWPKGRVSFYRGVIPQRVDFRLDLDLPDLAQAGLEHSVSDALMISRHRDDLAVSYVPVRPPPQHVAAVAWAPSPSFGWGGRQGTASWPICS